MAFLGGIVDVESVEGAVMLLSSPLCAGSAGPPRLHKEEEFQWIREVHARWIRFWGSKSIPLERIGFTFAQP